ncbi:hypothetical protein O181_008563 [Austropuccinia psidii MF-1]|uniref:Uncharacterized protein n=1 Tax=Austropuccinia psidii MF-1 TaxID=1389203 RepID=A0A9Q3GIM0_9BASI|nr:hypothetical protein [Austropuccinia psidii MF-1]
MKSKILYQHAQYEKTGELKPLKIRENKAIKELEINFPPDIQVEKSKYRFSQEKSESEFNWAQFKFQQEELELKKAVEKQNDRQMEESGKKLTKELDALSVRTKLEFEYKNKEFEQIQLKINL